MPARADAEINVNKELRVYLATQNTHAFVCVCVCVRFNGLGALWFVCVCVCAVRWEHLTQVALLGLSRHEFSMGEFMVR